MPKKCDFEKQERRVGKMKKIEEKSDLHSPCSLSGGNGRDHASPGALDHIIHGLGELIRNCNKIRLFLVVNLVSSSRALIVISKYTKR